MISAKEAIRIAEEAKSKAAKDELERIEKAVMEAACDGRSRIVTDWTVRQCTKKKLEMLGYHVVAGSQYNEMYTAIEWNDVLYRQVGE